MRTQQVVNVSTVPRITGKIYLRSEQQKANVSLTSKSNSFLQKIQLWIYKDTKTNVQPSLVHRILFKKSLEAERSEGYTVTHEMLAHGLDPV